MHIEKDLFELALEGSAEDVLASISMHDLEHIRSYVRTELPHVDSSSLNDFQLLCAFRCIVRDYSSKEAAKEAFEELLQIEDEEIRQNLEQHVVRHFLHNCSDKSKGILDLLDIGYSIHSISKVLEEVSDFSQPSQNPIVLDDPRYRQAVRDFILLELQNQSINQEIDKKTRKRLEEIFGRDEINYLYTQMKNKELSEAVDDFLAKLSVSLELSNIVPKKS